MAAIFVSQTNETAAIFVSQNNETAAMFVSQTSPLGVELFSYVNAFFCSNKFTYMLATWVKTQNKTAVLVHQENPVGVELFSYARFFFGGGGRGGIKFV